MLFRSLIGFDLGVALDRLRRSRVVGGSGCSLARRLCFVSGSRLCFGRVGALDQFRHSRFVGASSGCYQARRLCFRESWSFARSLFCTFTYLLSIFTSLSDASNMM